MRFLIDECLHTSLMSVAHNHGFACDHVNFLGLGGFKDRQLMKTILAGEYTFVINNGSDFASLYRKETIQAGLVIVIPNVTPTRQRELFEAVLIHIGKRDLTNAVVEVSVESNQVVCREFQWP